MAVRAHEYGIDYRGFVICRRRTAGLRYLSNGESEQPVEEIGLGVKPDDGLMGGEKDLLREFFRSLGFTDRAKAEGVHRVFMCIHDAAEGAGIARLAACINA